MFTSLKEENARVNQSIEDMTSYEYLEENVTLYIPFNQSFDGWYKDAECTQIWNFDTDVVTASTNLYAKWKKAVYNINYN